jgi:ribosomal protein L29
MSMSAKAIESALAMNATIMEQAERIHDLELELFELRAEIARLTLRAPDLAKDVPQFGATSNCVVCRKRIVFCGDGVWLHCEPQDHGHARSNGAIVNPPSR